MKKINSKASKLLFTAGIIFAGILQLVAEPPQDPKPTYKPTGISPVAPGTVTPKLPSNTPTGLSPGSPGVITAPPANTTKIPPKNTTNAVKPDFDKGILAKKKVLLKNIEYYYGGAVKANFFYNSDDQMIRAEYWTFTSSGYPDTAVDHIFYDDQKRMTMIASSHFKTNNHFEQNLLFSFFYYDDNSKIIRKEDYKPGEKGIISDCFYTTSNEKFIRTIRNPSGNTTDTILRSTDGNNNLLFLRRGLGSATYVSFFTDLDPTTRYLPAFYDVFYTSEHWGKANLDILFNGNTNLVQKSEVIWDGRASSTNVEIAGRNEYGLITKLHILHPPQTYLCRMHFEYIVK